MAKTNSASRDIATTIHPYTNLKLHETDGPLVITEGDGVFVHDETGKKYLEGLAGQAKTQDAITAVLELAEGSHSGSGPDGRTWTRDELYDR